MPQSSIHAVATADAVRLLGPVEVWSDGLRLPAGTPQQRCVLAVLALAPRRPVPVTTLIDRVWGDRPPNGARSTLYSIVSRLRRTVSRLGGQVIGSNGCYLLDLEPTRIDLHGSRDLAARARRLVADSPDRRAEAAALLAEACTRWRGTPLSGLEGDWIDRVRAGLDKERLSLLVERFEAELACGRHVAVVGPLAAAYAEYPLAEPLAGLLMRALYHVGRRAEALEIFTALRRRMVEEIGDEPGTALRELHTRLLRDDPPPTPAPPPPRAGVPLGGLPRSAPSGTAPATPVGSSVPVVPAQLPADVTPFTGRTAELHQLDAWIDTWDGAGRTALALAVVEGAPGVGKTALAIHWAHRQRERFPDGQLHIDLHGYSAGRPPARPATALAHFLHALGVPPERVPTDESAAAAAFRSLTADRRMLVLIDNAATAEQIRPLLPGGSGCAVLVTSRDRLAGLVARDGARPLVLGGLTPMESVRLLSELIRPAATGPPATVNHPDPPSRPEEERDPASDLSVLLELAEWCGHLPLALRIAAANVSGRSRGEVHDYVARLRHADRLDALAVPGDPHTAVRPALDLSYTRRSGPARRLFRLLSLAPEDVTAETAAHLAGVPPARARELLAELADAHLLDRRAAGRYGLHGLLRSYAAERAEREEPPATLTAALDRLHDHLCPLAMWRPTAARPPGTWWARHTTASPDRARCCPLRRTGPAGRRSAAGPPAAVRSG